LGNGRSGASKDNVLLFAYGISWGYSNWDKGYAWCAGHGDDLPMRDTAEWLERKEHPDVHSKDSGKELGPYAVWTVKLSCGHYDYQPASRSAPRIRGRDPDDWTDDDGNPSYSPYERG
jgi:hypothetical protein